MSLIHVNDTNRLKETRFPKSCAVLGRGPSTQSDSWEEGQRQVSLSLPPCFHWTCLCYLSRVPLFCSDLPFHTPRGTFKKRSVMPAWYRWVPQIVFISSSQPALGVLFWKLSGCTTQFDCLASCVARSARSMPWCSRWRHEHCLEWKLGATFTETTLLDWLIDWLTHSHTHKRLSPSSSLITKTGWRQTPCPSIRIYIVCLCSLVSGIKYWHCVSSNGG